MNRKCGHSLLAVLMLLQASHALADFIVTTDGNLLSGDVRKTGTGYTVETRDGPVDVPAARVKKVLLDHPEAEPVKPAPDANPDPKVTPATAPAVADPKMLKSLLAQGGAAMAAHEFSDARDAFDDALSLDPSNAVAGRGLGFAFVKLGKLASAAKPLEVAASSQPLDRSLTLALSASLVAAHNPVSAVKYLATYLEAHSDVLDEPAINALGIVLAQVDRSATHTPQFTDAAKLYQKLNDQLNALQSNQKRWGIDWLPRADVEAKEKAHADAQKASDDASAQLQGANTAVSSAQSALISAQKSSAGPKKQQKVQSAQGQLNDATSKQKEAQNAYDAAAKPLADAPGPTFPGEIRIDGVDLSMNPDSPAAVATPVAKDDKSRQPTRYAVAFAIAPDVLVTASSVVEDATDITITTSDGTIMKAQVLQAHHTDGIAMLKIDGGKLPCLALANSIPPSESLTCLGYPEVELFKPLAKSMAVTASDQTADWTVRFDQPPRLPGGPILEGNTVIGVELGDHDSDSTAVPAVTLKALLKLVRDNAHPGDPAKDPKTAIVQVTAEH